MWAMEHFRVVFQFRFHKQEDIIGKSASHRQKRLARSHSGPNTPSYKTRTSPINITFNIIRDKTKMVERLLLSEPKSHIDSTRQKKGLHTSKGRSMIFVQSACLQMQDKSILTRQIKGSAPC